MTSVGRLTLPPGWVAWQPNLHAPWNDGALLYVSNVRLEDSCAVGLAASPHPADDSGRACRSPVAALAPGGILVTWYTPRFLRPVPTHGDVITYGTAPTHLLVERPGWCASIAGDVTLTAWMPQSNPALSNVVVTGCAREPAADFVTNFRDLLASIRY